ncbi:fatty acid synthase-like [Uranotaenia lowii]|uniref:fatty acid synthase-like n=1 Tax=Uranotaenia lowii TaxID=190385 RepID=UPI0024783786|nr:fatty acid synthase-like [Uranotaenia lowii]
MPSPKVTAIGSGESVVISGISGRFPQTDNLREFARNLYEKRDLVDDRELRWRHTMQDVPRRTGKINRIDKFDCDFFGVKRRMSDTMDPQLRMLIEHSFEAILDAGVNPESVRGSCTGVFCGVCFSETEARLFFKACPPKGLAVLGCAKSQLANRLSYLMDLKGPTFVVDTACSSSMYALDVAYKSIMNGECEAAIVAGTNLTLHPYITYQFALLGVLAKDGYCRPFDKDANGYSRSEAVCVVYLQKVKEAKRIYSYLVHSKTNCDGFKPEGITYPSGMVQQQLLQEFYSEVGISPSEVDFVEAHSTGTFVGDPEECDALDKVYCTGRDRPLPVGSVKSSIGHSEAAAGVCSIAKCIIAMENDLIPPNINFTQNKPTIPSLVEGRLKVVNEPTPLEGPLVAINSFGFGGANAHALMCRNLRDKRNRGLPDDSIPRLLVWSGRHKEALEVMLQDVAQRPLDTEFISLLYNIQQKPIVGHRYRGFGIYRKNGAKPALLQDYFIDRIKLDTLPLVTIFSGINPLWKQELEVLRQFAQVDVTAAKCEKYLKTLKFDMMRKPSPKEGILFNMVGTTVLQIATVDLLQSIGLEFDYYAGHSVGQFTCAYLDRSITWEQAVLLALWHGLAYCDCDAACELSAFVKINSKLQKIQLEHIRKSEDSTFGVISGNERSIIEKNRQLRLAGLLTEILPFLSLRCEPSKNKHLNNKLHQTVNKLMRSIRPPTKKWLTAAIPKTSGIYYTSKLHSTVSVVNLLSKIPKHTFLMEIGTDRTCETVFNILNCKPSYIAQGVETSDYLCRLLRKIGFLHLACRNLDLAKLYPPIQFPVSRGTPMIAPLVRWDHRESYFVMTYSWEENNMSGLISVKISLSDQNHKYIVGHCIDGRILFPATGYLQLVWELMTCLAHRELNDFPIQFEDVRFLRATTIARGQVVTLAIRVQDASGFFEILEGDTVVVTGYAKCLSDDWKVPVLEDQPSNAVIVPTRDFYKELRLRGYFYTGLFKSVLEARTDSTYAKVQWNGSWVPFLDCLLQVGIIGLDTRSLVVPTAIDKIVIAPKLHQAHLQTDGDGREFYTVKNCLKTGVLACGGVMLCNPQVKTIERRNPLGVPVLESYRFVPYHSGVMISAEEAIRMCVQIALENVLMYTVNVAEVHNQNLTPVVQMFGNAIADIPLIKSSLTLLTNEPIQLENVAVKPESFGELSNILFLVTENNLANPQFIQSAIGCLESDGYVLLREKIDSKIMNFSLPDQFDLIATFLVDTEEIFTLLRLKSKFVSETPVPIQINSSSLDWLAEVKQSAKTRPLVLYSQNDSISGVIGLVNCIRKEPGAQNVRCVFIDDPNAPLFSLDNPIYSKQLELNLAINVLRNGVWGSYRHALISRAIRMEPVKHHCYANCLTRGDLSSLMWFSGGLNELNSVPQKVRVMYSSLNFRDVMIATGRISSDSMDLDRLEKECELGYEYSGITEDGRRVMGMMMSGALATMVSCDPYLVWEVPTDWSLEEAATVPLVYATVYMAFFICANIQRGGSILIHAGSGGVGLAAIQVALAYGLEVFTTVSTEEKKEYLLENFPSLDSENIGNSRDTSFEQMVKVRTGGKGVDFVLNSLSDEKLQASVRCLGAGGHFLEIGKYDISKNSQLAMTLFRKGLTFSSIMLDMMFREIVPRKQHFQIIMARAFASGIVKPLRTSVFEAAELEKAVRFLATGKHIGKVLLKMRNREQDQETLPIPYVPRVYCNPEQVYVIVGGLGGFGLELADWLIIRGCRKLVLSSSRGISKPYQRYRIETWQRYGVQTMVCTSDITTEKGCYELLQQSSSFGSVCAIYNLAVKLRDSILENQTIEMFMESLAPKAAATAFLDRASRELCPQLRYFVVFSSVSCGRGNAGQSNYGMANSVMERIIERRHAEGLPAKAIQWGAIGDVGLVADMAEDKIDLEIGGTLQQRITSCLQELDILLTTPDPIVASMVVAEKRLGSGSKNIIEAVMNIMNIRELKSVSMESTLADIGMDSLMAVEIKQVLERDFELVLSPQELRTLTFAKLTKLVEEKKQNCDTEIQNEGPAVTGMQMLLRNLGNESNSKRTILKLASGKSEGCPVLIVPGLEGVAGNVWDKIAQKVNAPVYMLQLMSTVNCNSVAEIVDTVLDELISTVFSQSTEYLIAGYSFGALPAVEIAKRLQAKGKTGKILLIDGAPKFLKVLAISSVGGVATDSQIQKMLMSAMISIALPNLAMDKIRSIFEPTSYQAQVEKFIEISKNLTEYSPDYTRKMATALFKRIKMSSTYKYDEGRFLNSSIVLVRPTEVSCTDIEHDYGLSANTSGEVTVQTIEGSHMTMLENPALVDIVNKFCQ